MNTVITDVNAFLDHIVAATNMRCLTPPSALTGACGFLAANLYAKSVFGEDALVNVSIEQGADGRLAGFIRIRRGPAPAPAFSPPTASVGRPQQCCRVGRAARGLSCVRFDVHRAPLAGACAAWAVQSALARTVLEQCVARRAALHARACTHARQGTAWQRSERWARARQVEDAGHRAVTGRQAHPEAEGLKRVRA